MTAVAPKSVETPNAFDCFNVRLLLSEDEVAIQEAVARFDDPGASRYIDACQEFKAFPPEDGWAEALELKEK